MPLRRGKPLKIRAALAQKRDISGFLGYGVHLRWQGKVLGIVLPSSQVQGGAQFVKSQFSSVPSVLARPTLSQLWTC
jgi:hypothetical protein